MLKCSVTARRIDSHGSEAFAKDARIVLDTYMAERVDEFNAAEMLLASLAACLLKGAQDQVSGRTVKRTPTSDARENPKARKTNHPSRKLQLHELLRLITYDKMSGPVLILISLGHDELATDAENEVMT